MREILQASSNEAYRATKKCTLASRRDALAKLHSAVPEVKRIIAKAHAQGMGIDEINDLLSRSEDPRVAMARVMPKHPKQ